MANEKTMPKTQPRRIKQKLIGLGLIAISIVIIVMASQGITVDERDGTAVMITLPVGLYMLFSKKSLIL